MGSMDWIDLAEERVGFVNAVVNLLAVGNLLSS
jgi:hypothetical protein